MHTDYKSPTMKQLRDQQVRFAPRNKKLQQVDRSEKLLAEIDPRRTYTYEYICFRITGFRPIESPLETVGGQQLRHDLRLFVEDMSEAAKVRVDEVEEHVCTMDELSDMFNVSPKTISRWRDRGLVSRRFLFDGRRRVGFLQSSVDRFVAENEPRIKQSRDFRTLAKSERDDIIRRARRMASAGGNLSQVSRRIASSVNCSPETVRHTLTKFDDEHPDLALFADRTQPLRDDAKRRIFQQHRRGKSIETMAEEHGRTRSTIYRVINEVRARKILELPLDYMDNEVFTDSEKELEIMLPLPDAEGPKRKTRMPSGLPPYLAALYELPLLSREQEQHLFRQYNYLKFKASQLREQLNPANANVPLMDEIEELYNKAQAVKNRIVQANLRLVVSIAKRHVSPSENFFELVSDGNMSLIRAVEKFDFSRGNKFSTYASWAIMKNFARTIPGEFKYRDRFRTSHDEMFASTQDDSTSQFQQESAQQSRERQVGKILARLDDREKRIIVSRFGLDYSQQPQTLKEVGSQMGVTKERIRQIEARALNKLRAVAKEEKIELPS